MHTPFFPHWRARLAAFGHQSANRAVQQSGIRHHFWKAFAETPAGGAIALGRVLIVAVLWRPPYGVIVNQAMVDALWPNQNPIGKCIRFNKPDAECTTVIGVAQTAIFNMDMAAFLTKWLQDVRDDQLPDGRFPDFAPNPNSVLKREQFFGAPAWGDAGHSGPVAHVPELRRSAAPRGAF